MSKRSGAGRRVDNKYVLIEELGKGGMASVWLARDERLGKLWAIKEIRRNEGGLRGEALRQSMIAEANFMKRLDHAAIPRVVDILDTGTSVFVVMDYVDGIELGRALRQQGHPFEQGRVIDWGIQLCDVLEYLHNANPPVVYRDMKPSNILLREDGTVKLVDFGVAMECVLGRNNDGRIAGTPGYAAPEQMPSDHATALDPRVIVDGRADVYALGSTLYSLVTGHVPKGESNESVDDAESFRMRPIREWNPRLSEGLERIILKATAYDPKRRYQSIEQMRDDLEHYERLTKEWRDVQYKKIRAFVRCLVSALVLAACGMGMLIGADVLSDLSYEGYLYRAAEASCVERRGGASEAEELYTQAILLRPLDVEAYRGLLGVYEHDHRLSREEDARLRAIFGSTKDLRNNRGYARLCFEVGTCYLSYFQINKSGGAVGNAGIASMEAAVPWFRRVVASCEDGDAGGQSIGKPMLHAAQSYLVIAEFHQRVAGAGREGRDSVPLYAEFWKSLSSRIHAENSASEAYKSAEGVRMRLCQVAVEATASVAYLTGFLRAGVTEREATELMAEVEECARGLVDFVSLEECRVVYGPVLKEVRAGLKTAKRSIRTVFASPVERMEVVRDGGAES